ncbi:hypothetical protein K7W03_20555 [Sphingobium sp. PNB]|uniref:hypothetical protein n=1 Tax=Sphingobium sp. PNB TaxID=863934 RepID=UPI001CA444B4|nr:hypothetical protein [Sphingobium sp. PNB]MCB4861987.1 hypothetical protein [Sphingobium sp. PNB]
MKQLLWSVALLAAPAMAQTKPNPSLFGITVMEPLTVPECTAEPERLQRYNKYKSKQPFGMMSPYPYSIAKDGPCYKRINAKAGTPQAVEDEAVWIDFPAGKSPSAAKYGTVSAYVFEGRVQRVFFQTYGISSQDDVFAQLKAKFGEPSSNKLVGWQNGFGAKYDAINAEWLLGGGLAVTFVGFDTSRDGGAVYLDTEAARKKMAEGFKALRNSGTQM